MMMAVQRENKREVSSGCRLTAGTGEDPGFVRRGNQARDLLPKVDCLSTSPDGFAKCDVLPAFYSGIRAYKVTCSVESIY